LNDEGAARSKAAPAPHKASTGGCITMTLEFPNNSRSYDPASGSIRFWGYDGVLEVPFFMDSGVLFRIAPRTNKNEAGVLQSFDSNWDRIVRAAGKAYSRGRKGSYALSATDF
jgi:hypothetical protein